MVVDIFRQREAVFRPIRRLNFAMARMSFAMAITDNHNIIVLFIVGDTYGYSKGGNQLYYRHNKLYISDGQNNIIYNINVIFIAINYINNNYSI